MAAAHLHIMLTARPLQPQGTMNGAEKLLVDVGLVCVVKRVKCCSMVTQFCLDTLPLLESSVDSVVQELCQPRDA